MIYLERVLINIAEQRKVGLNICLFIDALDEHSGNYDQNHWRLIEILQGFIAKADGKTVNIMLCLSSRPENIFKDVFKTSPNFQVHLQTNFDVQTYVHGRINTYLSSREDLSSNPNAIASLTATCGEIVRRAQGVFLWVALVTTYLIEALIDGESPEDLKQILSSIRGDGDLSQLYHRIMLRLNPIYLQEAFVMLQIAYAAIEPWPVTEFFEAVGYTCSRAQSLGSIRKWLSEHEMERRLLSRCRGILELQDSVDKRDDPALNLQSGGKVVLFLHRTAKEFLASSKTFDSICSRLEARIMGNGHVFITRYRVRQHLRWYEQQPSLVRSIKDERKLEIFYQARMAEMTNGHAIEEALDSVSEFIDSHDLASAYFGKSMPPESWDRSFFALAVHAGLVLHVEHILIERQTYVQPRDGPVLHFAILEQSAPRIGSPFVTSPDMIRLLISKGADTEEKRDGFTAFGFAFSQHTSYGYLSPLHRAVLTVMLESGADPNVMAQRMAGSTGPQLEDDRLSPKETPPLSVPDTAVSTIFTPLQLAVRKADRDLTKLLLVHGARTAALTPDDWRYMSDRDEPMLHLVKRYHDVVVQKANEPSHESQK